MIVWLILVLRLAAASLKSHRDLLLENLALQHQLLVLSRGSKRSRLTPLDRALWIWLSHTWNGWKVSLRILQPDTVIQWHRAGFRLFWRWKSRPGKAGRRTLSPDIITLIREMNHANPLWGAPRIHGELLNEPSPNTWSRAVVSARPTTGRHSFAITSAAWFRSTSSPFPA